MATYLAIHKQHFLVSYGDSAKTSKGQQYVCKDQLSVTKLEAGHSYNVMVNPNGACALQKVN
ncbi:hypothetical protein [Aquella oligotrophica]|uniref:Uncharacterized protein n=1 Tax=Aquella oligotrophica TaxID=2067065 RepID=A0A2I7N411_9NEIS|nr:hypothetical protein [Aquella oligotrophica]AUR51207.1 hypothetical protein CUN60_02435 [Aquella oligotrophica]